MPCSPAVTLRIPCTPWRGLIWGLASARVHPGDPWLFSFCKAAQAKMFLANPAQLSMLVYCTARLGYRPPDAWIATWLETSQPQLPAFSAQNLANAAWGLSTWRFQAPDSWLSDFYSATSAVMPNLTPVGISQIQLALVTLGAGTPPPEQWVEQLVAVAEPVLEDMELLQLCNFGSALAHWNYSPPQETMAAFLTATQPQLVAATPTDLATLLWICNKLHYMPHQQWLELWLSAAGAALPRCQPQHLTTISLVLGAWGVLPLQGFSVEFWRTSRSRFADFTPYQLALTLWGLGRTRRAVPRAWATVLLSTFTQQLLTEATAEDVSRLLAAFAAVSVKPSGTKDWVRDQQVVQQQLHQLCVWLQPQLPSLEPMWLVTLTKGLVGLGLQLDASCIRALTDAASELGERLAPQQRDLLQKMF
eukprot:gene8328-8513_t